MTAIHIPKEEFVPYGCSNRQCKTEIIHFSSQDKLKKECPDCKMPLRKKTIVHLLVPDKERLWIINCEEGRRNRVEQWAPNYKAAGPQYPFHCTPVCLVATCYECLQNFDKLLADTSAEELQQLYQYVRLKQGNKQE